MPAADYIPEIQAQIDGGATVQQAFALVAGRHGISKHTLQTAYYRKRGKTPKAQPKRTRVPRPPVVSNGIPEAPTNDSIEGLLLQLRRNSAEHDRLVAALEAAIADHVSALARVRSLLAS